MKYSRLPRRRKSQKLADYLTKSPETINTNSISHPIDKVVERIKTRFVTPMQEQVLIPLFGNTRLEHSQSLGVDHEPSDSDSEEQAIKHRFITMSAQVALKGIGSVFLGPLNILINLWIIYFVRFVYQSAYHSLFIERRITYRVLDAIIVTTLFLNGMFFLAAVMGWLVFLAQWLMVKTEDRSRKSIISVFDEQPHTVFKFVNGVEVEIPIEQLLEGDIVVVSAGQVVPADGTVIDGTASIDQRVLTGEAQPAEKGSHDTVLASTLILSGQIYVQVDKTGAETVTAQIGQMLINTADFKENLTSETEKFVNRVSPIMLALSLFSYPFIGVIRALSVLYSIPGYRMIYFGPISMLSFLHVASQKGILIKDGRSLEQLRGIDTIVFDKTGTLTEEQPYVSRIHSCSHLTEQEVLQIAAAAEFKQTHPIALGILQAAEERGVQPLATDNIHYELGYGIRLQINGKSVYVGSTRFMQMEQIAVPLEIQHMENESHAQGRSVVMVALQHKLVGLIELSPTIRSEAKEIVRKLKERGLNLYIISGDHAMPTQQLAEELDIDSYFAEVLPEDKASLVEKLQQSGHSVCFVGDGINDSIALKKADVSVSLRGATTIATDTAQVVLMDESLRELDTLFSLGKEYSMNMRTNFTLSTVPNVLTAFGALFLGWTLVPVIVITQLNIPIALYNSIRPLLENKNYKSETSTKF